MVGRAAGCEKGVVVAGVNVKHSCRLFRLKHGKMAAMPMAWARFAEEFKIGVVEECLEPWEVIDMIHLRAV